MNEDVDLMGRLLAAAGAEESPIDREEHAGRVAEVVERVRGSAGAELADDLLERLRAERVVHDERG